MTVVVGNGVVPSGFVFFGLPVLSPDLGFVVVPSGCLVGLTEPVGAFVVSVGSGFFGGISLTCSSLETGLLKSSPSFLLSLSSFVLFLGERSLISSGSKTQQNHVTLSLSLVIASRLYLFSELYQAPFGLVGSLYSGY